jgi:hypothetical protein
MHVVQPQERRAGQGGITICMMISLFFFFDGIGNSSPSRTYPEPSEMPKSCIQHDLVLRC